MKELYQAIKEKWKNSKQTDLEIAKEMGIKAPSLSRTKKVIFTGNGHLTGKTLEMLTEHFKIKIKAR